jgi:recombination protein RecA
LTTNNTDFEQFLARLNPKTAQSFRVASEVKNELLLTPSLGLNMALGGGIGYGRFSIFYGNRGCGKTLVALECVAKAQKEGKICAWIDVEKNFNPDWARQLGVDPDKMIVATNIMSIADMADEGKNLILAGVDVLVIDSISQLLPQSFFEDPKDEKKLKEGQMKELKGLAGTGQIGTFSKNMGQAVNILNAVNEKTAIIMISQVRNNIGSYGASISFMGGKAVEHAASTTIKFWRTPSDVLTREIHVGDGLLLTRPAGAPVTWTVEKNRGPGMGASNEYDMYTAGDSVGVDVYSEVVTFGVEHGIIKKGGAWFTYGDFKAQGKPAMVSYFRDNPDEFQKVYDKILSAA